MIQTDITLHHMSSLDVINAIKKIDVSKTSVELECHIWNNDFDPESWSEDIEKSESQYVQQNERYYAHHSWCIYNPELKYCKSKSKEWNDNHKKLCKNITIPFITLSGCAIQNENLSETVYNYFTEDNLKLVFDKFNEFTEKYENIYSIVEKSNV